MKDEFYNIYNNLYNKTYPLIFRSALFLLFSKRIPLPKSSKFMKIISDSIDETITNFEIQNLVRPDAKHFLLINFHQMVILPILMEKSGNISSTKLESSVRKDIYAIISEAYEKKKHLKGNSEYEEGYIVGDDSQKISSRDILASVSFLWSKLSTNKLEMWG